MPVVNRWYSETRWTGKKKSTKNTPRCQCKYTIQSNLACISSKYSSPKAHVLQVHSRYFLLWTCRTWDLRVEFYIGCFRGGFYLLLTYWTEHFLYTPPFIPQFPNLSPLILAFSKHRSGAFRAPVWKIVNLSKPPHCLKNMSKKTKTMKCLVEDYKYFTLNYKCTFSIYSFTLWIKTLAYSIVAICFHVIAWVTIHDINIIWTVGIASIAVFR